MVACGSKSGVTNRIQEITEVVNKVTELKCKGGRHVIQFHFQFYKKNRVDYQLI